MLDRVANRGGFIWWLPLCAVVGACTAFLPIIAYGSDMEELLYVLVVAPAVSIALVALVVVAVVRKRSRQVRSALLALTAYIAVTGALFMSYGQLRPALRWLLWSERFKSEVLRSPDSASGELKHVEWDGWGWGGNDTVVYLVFDPSDSLAAAAKKHSSGKFRGIPCEVPLVRRLESRWYSVVFYTDTGWGHCL